MEITQDKLKSTFSFKRILIPIIIGVSFSAFSLIQSDFNFQAIFSVQWSITYLLLAVFMMILRDLAYIIRLRILTGNTMSWRNGFQVVMLWEFASAVTPSMVGGSAFAIYFMNREGYNWGKSTGIVMITAMLDELFYIVAVAFSLLILGNSLFDFGNIFGFDPKGYFYLGYSVIIFLTSIIFLGVFISPQGAKNLFSRIFSIKILKKWKSNVERIGDELIATSNELKGKSIWYWLKAFLATTFSWTARFFVLNFLILALNPDLGFEILEQLKIYAQQLVMWVIMLISPTPGASGIAEVSFSLFFGDYFPENAHAAVAVLWRSISYYPYLIIGLLVLPIWIARTEKLKIVKTIHDLTINTKQKLHIVSKKKKNGSKTKRKYK